MAFAVTVNAQRWRDHQDTVCDAVRRSGGAPLVPVIKGNGYGLGQRLLVTDKGEHDLLSVRTIEFEAGDA